MNAHEFRFSSRGALERAVSAVLSCEEVEDCLVESSALRLRFRAPRGRSATHLVERIHRAGNIARAGTTDLADQTSPWWDSIRPGRNWG